jgi:hypothetical protein
VRTKQTLTGVSEHPHERHIKFIGFLFCKTLRASYRSESEANSNTGVWVSKRRVAVSSLLLQAQTGISKWQLWSGGRVLVAFRDFKVPALSIPTHFVHSVFLFHTKGHFSLFRQNIRHKEIDSWPAISSGCCACVFIVEAES